NIEKNEASRRGYLSQYVKKLGIKPEPSCWAGWAEIRERPASLEETILIGLAKLRKRGNKGLSTTEIAHELNTVFGESDFRTNKNNVSRYFNFQMHPFYRIVLVGGTLRYSLSATGLSRAQRIMASAMQDQRESLNVERLVYGKSDLEALDDVVCTEVLRPLVVPSGIQQLDLLACPSLPQAPPH